MTKPEITSILQEMKGFHFSASDSFKSLGTIAYIDNTFTIKLVQDYACKYLCLEYTVKDIKDISDSIESINERVVAGKYIKNGTDLTLQTFFPLIDKAFIEQQIGNSIHVIEIMIHICRH